MASSSTKFQIDEDAFGFPKLKSSHKPHFDCTNELGEDTQCLQYFIDKRALKNQTAHLGTTYIITYKKNSIGYVTVATSNIHKDKIIKKKRPATRDGNLYPALVILDFCIDKKFRGKGFGEYVLLWCNGLARIISDKVGCRYIVLFTKDAVNFYKKYQYQIAEIKRKDKFKLMYADIFPELK